MALAGGKGAPATASPTRMPARPAATCPRVRPPSSRYHTARRPCWPGAPKHEHLQPVSYTHLTLPTICSV
eukprot:8531036-Alexandrium_andersonii.AAC.1